MITGKRAQLLTNKPGFDISPCFFHRVYIVTRGDNTLKLTLLKFVHWESACWKLKHLSNWLNPHSLSNQNAVCNQMHLRLRGSNNNDSHFRWFQHRFQHRATLILHTNRPSCLVRGFSKYIYDILVMIWIERRFSENHLSNRTSNHTSMKGHSYE